MIGSARPWRERPTRPDARKRGIDIAEVEGTGYGGLSSERRVTERDERGKPVTEKRPEALESPDIEFTADVKAWEMRFDEVPETEVQFWGRPERASVSETERKNLPEEVRRGVTYRNFSVRLRIATELIDAEPDLWEKAEEE